MRKAIELNADSDVQVNLQGGSTRHLANCQQEVDRGCSDRFGLVPRGYDNLDVWLAGVE